MLKKLNNKGAFTLWERGFLYIILLCIFAFALDICILCLEIHTTSHQLAYVAEKLSFQGGFIGAKSPSSQYWSNQDVYNYFNKSMVRFGVDGKNLHWSLYCNGDRVIDTNNGEIVRMNYTNGSRVGVGQLAPHYSKSCSLTVNFQHKYFFSGQILKLNPIVKQYTLTNRFHCLYINN